jgi:hypothetical protein
MNACQRKRERWKIYMLLNACCYVDKVKTPTDLIMTNSLNLFHSICTKEISFNDENMLL